MPSAPRWIRVHLFASAREAAGTGRLDWTGPSDGLTAAELVRQLGEAYPRLRPILRTSRFVRNGVYLARTSEKIRPGDEFAVHPPYGGG
jgi:molybdopterin converting factor small subunit